MASGAGESFAPLAGTETSAPERSFGWGLIALMVSKRLPVRTSVRGGFERTLIVGPTGPGEGPKGMPLVVRHILALWLAIRRW